jgi:hypothetical protein
LTGASCEISDPKSIFLSGRRILYDYKKFGDSPACLSSGRDISGSSGVWQGYGYNAESKISFICEQIRDSVGLNTETRNNRAITTYLCSVNGSHSLVLREVITGPKYKFESSFQIVLVA